jgi:succinate dehydrogenase/fumarate reductase flavoprotein subunit
VRRRDVRTPIRDGDPTRKRSERRHRADAVKKVASARDDDARREEAAAAVGVVDQLAEHGVRVLATYGGELRQTVGVGEYEQTSCVAEGADEARELA